MKKDLFIYQKLRNLLHTSLYFGVIFALLALLGHLLLGENGLLLAMMLGGTALLLAPKFSPKLTLKANNARPLHPHEAPELFRMVEALSAKAHLQNIPSLYWIPSPQPNAFAIGTKSNPSIAMTQGLLEILDRRELNGVLAHEISHIRNNDIRIKTIAALAGGMTRSLSFAGRVMLFLNFPLWLFGYVSISWWAILLLLAAPSINKMIQMALSRTREFEADLGAAQLTGDPEGLAKALQKLELMQANQLIRMLLPTYKPSTYNWLSSHPATTERVDRLRQLALREEPVVIVEEDPRQSRYYKYKKSTQQPVQTIYI
ncbi:zinc metalloprotease HtpX [Limibacter armeniacum]|uniref:zinc metalloprotease HtpX n=1 Tax=Limibacter armeniacum TaxID=466084 RepID=UPI002FE555DB